MVTQALIYLVRVTSALLLLPACIRAPPAERPVQGAAGAAAAAATHAAGGYPQGPVTPLGGPHA